MFFRKKKKVKKQYALFTEAIKEAGYLADPDEVKINHELPKCYYRSEEFNIIFPLRFLRESRKLNYDKIYDFCFRGLQTPKRDWVEHFATDKSRISFTDNGRKISKGHFDVQYYQEISNSKFTLCPAGDFKWTYRFLEASMCRSIPVIERGMEHSQCEGFVYFYSDQIKEELVDKWNENILIHNYKLFLTRHTLIDRFIFKDALWP